MGLRNRLRNLEREVEEDLVALVCRECGEEHGHWVTPEDALAVHGHPCGYMAFRDKRTGEPLFRWGVARKG